MNPNQQYQPMPGQIQPGQMQPGQFQPGQPQPGQYQPGQPGQPQPGQYQPVQPGQPQPGQYQQGQPQPGQYQQGQPQPGQYQPGQPGQPQPGQFQPEQAPPQPGFAQAGQVQPDQFQQGQIQPGQMQQGQMAPMQQQQNQEEPAPIEGALGENAALPSYDNYQNVLPPAPVIPQAPDASQWTTMVTLDPEGAMTALREHIAQNFCWGSGPADKMEIKMMTPSTALKYQFTSWTEHRRTEWSSGTPYHNERLDFNNFPKPGLWDFQVIRPSEEGDLNVPQVNRDANGIVHTPIPGTEVVKLCSTCHGKGRVHCNSCNGSGKTTYNDEDGHPHSRPCGMCGGKGQVPCDHCDGRRYLKHYLQVVTTFATEKSSYLYETTDLPDEEILKASGTCLFTEAGPAVGAIWNYSVPEVNQNSARIHQEHRHAHQDRLTYKQAQQLDSVPVFEVAYHIGGEPGRFWVMGDNHVVYSNDYPAQCCRLTKCDWCCNNCSCCNSCSIM